MNSLGWLGGGTAPLVIAAASARIGFSAAISASGVIYVVLACILLQHAGSKKTAGTLSTS